LWKYPDGTSKGDRHLRGTAKTFPEMCGFGVEEWLGKNWLWTGQRLSHMQAQVNYYCGYLQAFKINKTKPAGFFADVVYLFMIDTGVRNGPHRYYVGEIHNCYKLDLADARIVYNTYHANGQLQQMQNDLNAIPTDPKPFTIYDPSGHFVFPDLNLNINLNELCIFNICFEKIVFYHNRIHALSEDPAYRSGYYNDLYVHPFTLNPEYVATQRGPMWIKA